MKIARFEKRIAAWIIDYIISFIGSLTLFLFLNQKWKLDITESTLVIQMFDIVAYFLLTIFEMLVLRNKTLGMLFVRTRIVYVPGGRVPLYTKFIRALTMSMTTMCFVNAIYMLTIHSERTIFDKLTDSIVVDKDAW